MKKLIIFLLSTFILSIGITSCGGGSSSSGTSNPGGGGVSNQALITSFTIDGQLGQTDINNEDGTITVSMPQASDLMLSPTIEVSRRASVIPGSGEEQYFSDSVPYTVTAEDATTTKVYQVTVTTSPVISPTVSYNPYDSSRLGAGDLYKEDLFTVSDVEDGDYSYTIALGSYSREANVTVTNGSFNVQISDPNGSNYSDDELTADETLKSDQVNAGVDGSIELSLRIGNIEYFNQTVNKEQYNLKTPNDAQGMQHDLSGDYTLANDIDMSTIENFRPIAYDRELEDGHQGSKFTGSIDGVNYIA